MNLQYIIDNLDKSKDNEEYMDYENICRDLGLSSYDITLQGDSLKCYWISNRICTDTWVGWRAYYLDDVFVCGSSQSCRKGDENFYWVDKKSAVSTMDYLKSLMRLDEEDLNLYFIDLEQDCGDGYSVSYSSEILTNTLLYKGITYYVVATPKERYKDMRSVVIGRQGDTPFEVNVEDTLSPYKLKGD